MIEPNLGQGDDALQQILDFRFVQVRIEGCRNLSEGAGIAELFETLHREEGEGREGGFRGGLQIGVEQGDGVGRQHGEVKHPFENLRRENRENARIVHDAVGRSHILPGGHEVQVFVERFNLLKNRPGIGLLQIKIFLTQIHKLGIIRHNRLRKVGRNLNHIPAGQNDIGQKHRGAEDGIDMVIISVGGIVPAIQQNRDNPLDIFQIHNLLRGGAFQTEIMVDRGLLKVDGGQAVQQKGVGGLNHHLDEAVGMNRFFEKNRMKDAVNGG